MTNDSPLGGTPDPVARSINAAHVGWVLECTLQAMHMGGRSDARRFQTVELRGMHHYSPLSLSADYVPVATGTAPVAPARAFPSLNSAGNPVAKAHYASPKGLGQVRHAGKSASPRQFS